MSRAQLVVPLVIGLAVLVTVVVAVQRASGPQRERVDAAVGALRTGPAGRLELPGGSLVHETGNIDIDGASAITARTWVTNLDDTGIRAAIEPQLARAGFTKIGIGRPPPGSELERQLSWWRNGDLVYRLTAQALPLRIAGRQYGGAKSAAFGVLSREPASLRRTRP